MDDVLQTVLSTIRSHQMFEVRDSVVAAVSGGPDSICLLHILNDLSEEFRLRLTVAHLDHKTRNGDSTHDALFVKSISERMGLECHGETLDVTALKPPGASFETAARDARYAFLLRVAKKTGSTKIALGHTANDQAETILMRLLSGTGRRGLGGIRPVRSLDDVVLVRPLINVKRHEVLAYLESNNIAFRVDRSNLYPTHARNKIRLELIPMLEKEYNPHVVDALLRAAAVLQEEEEYLSDQARDALGNAMMNETGAAIELSRTAYRSVKPVIRRRWIMEIADKLSPSSLRLTADCIEAADTLCMSSRPGSRMFVSKQIELLVEHDRIVVRWVSEKSAEPPGEHTLAVPVPGHVSLAAFGIELETKVFDRSQSTPELIAQCGPNRQFFDGEKLCGNLYVRRKLPGDYFYPLGLSGRKKLSDYFTDEKYPRERRQRTALLLSGDHIMWIIGGAIDERFKLTDATRNVLEVQCARIDQTV